MAVHLACPACEATFPLQGDPPDDCPRCGEAIPAELRARAREALRLQRPLGLTLIMWFLAFWSGAAALALLSLAIGDDPVQYRGRLTPHSEVFDIFLPVLGPLALAGAAAVSALWLKRPWARWALMLVVVLTGVIPGVASVGDGPAGPREAWIGLIAMVPLGLALGWYLYLKPNVRVYFARLEEER